MSQSAYACLEPFPIRPDAVLAAARHLDTLPYDEPVASVPRKVSARTRRRRRILPALTCLAAVSAAWALVMRPHGEVPVVRAVTEAAPVEAPAAPPVRAYAWMLEPAPVLAEPAAGFGRDAPLAPAFRQAGVQVASLEVAAVPAAGPGGAAPSGPVRMPAAVPAAAPVRIAAAEPAPIAPSVPSPIPSPIPLPVPRPAELRPALAVPAQRVAGRRALPPTRDVFHAAMAEEPSFFEKLFGAGKAEAPRQALAYANPDALPQESPRPRISPSPETGPSAGTAVYDISASRVTLPTGEVLEAHSGLGAAMDDPRYVHLRMRGATPPGTYDLTERERPFHGVRAIRLNPVGGSAAIHGRDGLLAHTYMLRQPGASNGCVSFRDYDRFLQAFLRGEVRRLVVVAGGGRGDFFGRRIGMAERAARGA